MRATPEVRELTPAGRGGVSVVRVSGPGARERVAARILAGAPAPGRPTLVRLGIDGEELDEALVLVEGPERVELHVHGSPLIVRRLLSALAGGPQPPGSLEERARERCARAPSEAAARMLLDQAEGALRRELGRLVLADPAAWRAGVARLRARAGTARALLEPPRVALAGPVNAGKSTLFNALVGRERVTASDEAGTTRDLVVERVRLGAYAVDLVDTAGDRGLAADDARAAVERAGQGLAREARRDADLVLWLQPAGDGTTPAVDGRTRVLVSQADRLPAGEREGIRDAVAALHEPEDARRVVERVVHEALDLPLEPWVPGAAVPFEQGLVERLEELAGVVVCQDRRVGLRDLE